MIRAGLYLFALLIILASCSANSQFLKETWKLPDYPSGSGIEFYNNRFYIIGDDATQLLVLDSNLVKADSFKLFNSTAKRISKDSKPDLESITSIYYKNQSKLLMVGSGSLDTIRNQARILDPTTRESAELRLDVFYQRLKLSGLPELNIEGLCSIPGAMVLSNRGHKGSPRNHLIFTENGFWEKQSTASINLIKVGNNPDSNSFSGVSGLAYAKKCDKLLLTVSTEDTRSVYEDGAIGKSYLWIIDNISSKKKWNAINPNRIIDLDKTNAAFKGQKIESVCVIKETKNFIQLALVADNDDGSSVVFLLDVSKK